MTFKELQRAFVDETPVMYNGVKYNKILAIIFIKKDGHILETAQLLDECGYSTVTVQGKHVEEVSGDDGNRADDV